MNDIKSRESLRPNSTVSETQLKHASEWVEEFIKINKVKLQTEGIQPMVIHNLYSVTTKFPMGPKSFFPLVHLFGLERIRKGNTMAYVMFI